MHGDAAANEKAKIGSFFFAPIARTDDIKQFRTRCKHTMKLLIHIGDVLLEVVENIKMSGAYGLLSDGVTNVSNQHQNHPFIKYYDESAGDARTVDIDTGDLLAGGGEEYLADGETTFKSLIALLERLGPSDLKAMASNGASVKTGKHTGVGARFQEMDECKAMLSVHCICHRLALACADTGDGLEFVKSFEATMTSLWACFKKSSK